MTLAHVGHWIADLLYVLPLIVMGALLLAGRLKQRRSGRRPPPAGGSG